VDNPWANRLRETLGVLMIYLILEKWRASLFIGDRLG
jgi:hypothetical protein